MATAFKNSEHNQETNLRTHRIEGGLRLKTKGANIH